MVNLHNLTTTPVNEELLKKKAEQVLAGEKKSNNDLSIVLVGPGRMRKLNKRHLAKNRATDVLSFSGQEIGKEKFIAPLKNVGGLGEVVLCLREINKNAKKFNSSLEKELISCLVHGILHLLGFDHEKNEANARQMQAKEKLYTCPEAKL